MNILNKKTVLIIAVLISVFLAGCSKNMRSYSKSGLYYDTMVSVSIYSNDGAAAQKLLDGCMDICAHYEELFDEKIPSSDIAKINNSEGCVKVDHDTALLISDSLHYAEITNGRFDITIKPVSRLWDFHDTNGTVPDDDLINEALKDVGYKNITVDTVNDTVTLPKGVSIDPGAAAKGYIADRLADYLEDNSITNAIINMGGDMRLLGSKPGADGFIIGINDPFNSGNVLTAVSLSDTSVATSGTYERYFITDNTKYYHILDPATGYPADTDIESVTVISEYSVDCDCLCTSCILLGKDDALSLIESIPDTEAIFVLNDKSIIKTSGADKLIRQ